MPVRRYNSSINLSRSPKSEDLHKLYLKNLPRGFRNREKLIEICSKYGKVVHVKVDLSSTFGFVSFATPDDLEKAKNQLPNDHGLTVEIAKSRESNSNQRSSSSSNRGKTRNPNRTNSESNGRNQSRKEQEKSQLQNQPEPQQQPPPHQHPQSQQQAQPQQQPQSSGDNYVPPQTSNVVLQQNYCILCFQLASFTCARCGDWYCSPNCQKIDWEKHRYICSAMPKLCFQNIKSNSNTMPCSGQNIQQQVPPMDNYSLQMQKNSETNLMQHQPNFSHMIPHIGQNIQYQLPPPLPFVNQQRQMQSNSLHILPYGGQNIQYQLPSTSNYPILAHVQQKQLQQSSNTIPRDNKIINSAVTTSNHINETKQQPNSSKASKTESSSANKTGSSSANKTGSSSANKTESSSANKTEFPNANKTQSSNANKTQSSNANKIGSSNTNTSVSCNQQQQSKLNTTSLLENKLPLTINLLDLLENASSTSNATKPSTNLNSNSTPQICDVTNTSSSSAISNNTKLLIDLNSSSSSQASDLTASQSSASDIIVPMNSSDISALIEKNKEISIILNHPLLSAPEFPANGTRVVTAGVIPDKINLVFVRSVEGNADRQYITLLNEIANEARNTPLKQLPKIGDIVASDFEGCGQYRAIVLDSSNENMISIIYIDIGVVTTKKLKELNDISNYFKTLPRQTVPVYLKGISSGIKPNDKLIDYLEQFIDNIGTGLKIYYEKSNGNYIVDAELIDKNNESINKKILELTK